MSVPLLLASKSSSRRFLLEQTQIPFTIIKQDADEAACDWNLPLEQVVKNIARYKMEHAVLPHGKEGDICFVLTADTLSQDSTGAISGKPVDRADAIAKINRARAGMYTGTAFCLDRKQNQDTGWIVQERIEKFVASTYQFNVPDAWIEEYLENSWGLQASGAIAIEFYGMQFLKSINGSYSAVMGLPLFELREALEKIGFFKK